MKDLVREPSMANKIDPSCLLFRAVYENWRSMISVIQQTLVMRSYFIEPNTPYLPVHIDRPISGN